MNGAQCNQTNQAKDPLNLSFKVEKLTLISNNSSLEGWLFLADLGFSGLCFILIGVCFCIIIGAPPSGRAGPFKTHHKSIKESPHSTGNLRKFQR